MTDLQQQIADTRRHLDAIDAAADRGEVPMLADARLLASYAQHVLFMVAAANVDKLRATPERTAAEDRAAQVFLEAGK